METNELNEKKILFVTCVNNNKMYSVCRKHIDSLSIPEGYSIDFFSIYNAKSMAEGYNRALKDDAKYKVYLHQDTFILNRNFLHDVIKLFQENPKLGLLGTVGCIGVPKSGNWGKGELIGKYYIYLKERTKKKDDFGEIDASIKKVDLIDGYLMVTQYDIPWREDLFDGFHLYDSSQCMEFQKRGYWVGIPKQEDYWAYHHMEKIDRDGWKKYQEIFEEHYKDEL